MVTNKNTHQTIEDSYIPQRRNLSFPQSAPKNNSNVVQIILLSRSLEVCPPSFSTQDWFKIKSSRELETTIDAIHAQICSKFSIPRLHADDLDLTRKIDIIAEWLTKTYFTTDTNLRST